MTLWAIATILLLVWNATYCSLRIIADFRGARPADGIWGLFALAGVLSVMAMALLAGMIAVSGI